MATKLCPCGYHGDPQGRCSCTPLQVRTYLSRVSGPLLDRIDLQLEVPRVPFQDLTADTAGQPSAVLAQRVLAARRRQQERLGGGGLFCNAQMTSAQTRGACPLDAAGLRLLERAMERFGLSARAYTRILKIARTIADLDESPAIATHHLTEAVAYRTLDRQLP